MVSFPTASAAPVNIVIVGLNFGTHFLRRTLEPFHRKALTIVGVCDLDAEKSSAAASTYGTRAFESLEDVLADPEVEAVGLFTGPAGRAGLIRKIVRAGKHVLTTKPFEVDGDAAMAVLREARELGMVIALNSPSPTLPPDLATVLRWRTEFDLGRPIGARIETMASYHEESDGGWYDDPARCPVAPIFRIGIYLINDAVRLFGEAQQVSVLSSRIRTGRPTPDNAQLGILFKNGAIVNVFASFCIDDGDPYKNQMTLNFERGTIYRSVGPIAPEPLGSVALRLVQRGPEGRTITATEVIEDYSTHFSYQTDIFHRAVRGDKDAVTTTPETIVAGIRIVEAMSRAAASGGTAEVEPVERKVVLHA